MVGNFLERKSVIITGAGRGIGAACAKYAALHGASVIVNDLGLDEAETIAQEIRSSGGIASAVAADIRSWEQVQSLLQRCVDEFGRVDGIVNNAGVFRVGGVEDQTEDDLRLVIETNVLGTAFCGVQAARLMIKQGYGSIVNITSGAQSGLPRMSAYGASKGAVSSFTYSWAMDLEGSGVRVNAVSPRGQSQMTNMRRMDGGRSKDPDSSDEDGPAPDVNAPLVAFLLSNASTSIHGQVVRTDGSLLALCTHPAVLAPIYSRDSWTFEELVEVFNNDLSIRQVPLGMVGMEMKSLGQVAATWPRVGSAAR